MKQHMIREGNIVDVVGKRIFQGIVEIHDGKIISVKETATSSKDYILPGLVDAHIHIESSMLVPSEFAKLAVVHGTVASVSDPHEIANVLGLKGVEYMISNGDTVPFKFNFGAPSCVPATSFESSGSIIGAEQVERLLEKENIRYLSEMMNFPGVLSGDKDVSDKLAAAKKNGKPIDGHAPGLSGEDIKKYIQAGISTDHECFTIEEALEKIKYGMKIQIREGSAARNFDTLVPLLEKHADDVMFCSDDKHPDDLLLNHMNDLVIRSIALGYDIVNVIRACTFNPVKHYNLDVGLLQVNDPADMIIVDSLENFNVKETYIDGTLVASNGESHIVTQTGEAPNAFVANPLLPEQLRVPSKESNIRVIKALEGQLITKQEILPAKVDQGMIVSDIERDILKIVVLNRYRPSDPAIGFIQGFGFKSGAIASTVAHDSHNIVAVGTNDEDILKSVNTLIQSKGGISISNGNEKFILPLPVAGIMSNNDGKAVAEHYEKLNRAAVQLGTKLASPFMTLSFMALLVIPELKLSDKGLFNGNTFSYTSLYANE